MTRARFIPSGLAPYVILLRPHQYIKNILVFAPMFFSGKMTDASSLLRTFIAFGAFSMIASAVYILNDMKDVRFDRLHPTKRHRPLAAGTVRKDAATALMFGLGLAGLGVMALLSNTAFLYGAIYAVMSIAYSYILKHIVIVDVITVAVGFILRLFVGAEVSDVPLSPWIILLTFLFALFIALAKRRDDVVHYRERGEKMRRVIEGYNLRILDVLMVVSGVSVILVYLLYTLSPEVEGRFHNDSLYVTTIYVIIGIGRYLRLAFIKGKTGAPTTVMLRDKIIQMLMLGWITSFLILLY